MDFAGHNEAQNRVDGRMICLAVHLHPTCSLEISETFNNVDSLDQFLEILILWAWSKIGRIKQSISSFQKFSSSIQFSLSVVPDSLWPHESQHARPPCPSPTPGVHSDIRPSSQWCYPAISSSVVSFSSCSESLPASGSFPISQLFAWGGKVLELRL